MWPFALRSREPFSEVIVAGRSHWSCLNGFLNFACLRLNGNVPKLGLRLIRSLRLAHPSGFVYVARLPSAPFPPGTFF